MPIRHYFVTNRENHVTYLYYPSLTSKSGYEKLVYIPDKFETMTQQEIKNYKKGCVLKFIRWGLTNRKEIEDVSDSRQVISRFIDINSYIMMTFIAAMVMNRFFKKIDLPFVQLMFEDKPIKLSHIRVAGLLVFTGLGIRESINHVCNQTYLFDLMLKYKERVVPGEIYSSNCEALLNTK